GRDVPGIIEKDSIGVHVDILPCTCCDYTSPTMNRETRFARMHWIKNRVMDWYDGELATGRQSGLSAAPARPQCSLAAAVQRMRCSPGSLCFFGNLLPPAASNGHICEKRGKTAMQGSIVAKTAPAAAGDTELVKRALARNEAAVRDIIKANNRRLYRLARGILRNDGEAEDVVQETYVRAFTRLA